MKRLSKLIIPLSCINSTALSFLSAGCNNQIKTYLVHTFNSANDIDWDNVPKANVDIYKWTNNSFKYDTFAQMVYINNTEFVIRLFSYEPDPLVVTNPDDKDVFMDSCLEAFMNFNSSEQYINVEVNSVNRNCQEFGLPWSKGQRQYIANTEYCATTTVEKQQGQYWSTIINITLDNICHWYNQQEQIINKSDFKTNYTFTGNFYTTCGTEGEKKHYGMWNDVNNPQHSFHDPSCFGKFIIVE